jgi:hypothetical protein
VLIDAGRPGKLCRGGPVKAGSRVRVRPYATTLRMKHYAPLRPLVKCRKAISDREIVGASEGGFDESSGSRSLSFSLQSRTPQSSTPGYGTFSRRRRPTCHRDTDLAATLLMIALSQA